MQSLIPIRNPSIPLSGLLVLMAVIFFSLGRDAKRRSKPYLVGLASIAFELLVLILAVVAPTRFMATFWYALTRAGLYALASAWLWLSVDASGAWHDSPRRRAALIAAAAASAILALFAVTNPLHGLHWAAYRFEGRVLVISPGPAATIGEWYRYAVLAAGLCFYLPSLFRHSGAERARLAVLGLAFVLVVTGDALWIGGAALPIGMNPLSVCSTLAAYISGMAYLRYGLPRAAAPITEADLKRRAAPLLRRPGEGDGDPGDRGAARGTEAPEARLDAFLAEAGLSERQKAIAIGVAGGLAYKAVAAQEGITERTVKYHMARILDKLDLETREQLIALIAYRGAAGA